MVVSLTVRQGNLDIYCAPDGTVATGTVQWTLKKGGRSTAVGAGLDEPLQKGISSPLQKKIAPYQLPTSHPDYIKITALFMGKRPTYSATTFADAGFEVLATKRLVLGGVHPTLPRLFFKAYYDKVADDPSKSFLKRVATARTMRQIIADNRITTVVVPEKFIYVLPKSTAALIKNNKHAKKIILVEDYIPLLGLYPTKDHWGKEEAWTKTMIDDLYVLLSKISLTDCAYRNFQFTADRKKIALIDLETPTKKLSYFNKTLAKKFPPRWKQRWKGLRSGKIIPYS
jgi:hypothetical protein